MPFNQTDKLAKRSQEIGDIDQVKVHLISVIKNPPKRRIII